jgi:hypothetical protein
MPKKKGRALRLLAFSDWLWLWLWFCVFGMVKAAGGLSCALPSKVLVSVSASWWDGANDVMFENLDG